MSMNKTKVVLPVLLAAGIALSGCGKERKGTDSPDPLQKAELDQTPVTLTMVTLGSSIADEEFKTMIADPVKQKYPFITIELHQYQPGENFEKYIAAGLIPDIVYSGILDIPVLQTLQLQFDLTPFIKKYGVDLNDFEDYAINMVKRYGANGEMYSMPFTSGFPALYYNKDIFDLFGTPYPKEGMTWQETIDLARRVTRSDGGVQFKGLGLIVASRLSLSMLLEKFDPQTGKVNLTTDHWKQMMDTYKQIRTIPGNEGNLIMKQFRDDKNIAMFTSFNGDLALLEQNYRNGDAFDWDLTTFPSWPGKELQVDTPMQMLSVTAQSKYKDQAFNVLKVVTSKENQLAMSKSARPSVRKDPEIQKSFGQDYESLNGKNTAAMFKYKHQPVNYGSLYDSAVNPEITKAADRIVKGEADINTALREAEEKANAAIEALKKQ